MAVTSNETPPTEQDGVAHRVARRTANRRTTASTKQTTDGQGLVELACEFQVCSRDG